MNDWATAAVNALRGLDIRAEAAAMGVVFSGGEPNASGWIECYSVERDEDTPSAAVNVSGEDRLLGRYTDLGGNGRSISFFELAAKIGGFPDWKAARDHFLEKAGVAAPVREARGQAGAGGEIDAKVTWLETMPAAWRIWCERFKRPIKPETLYHAGARMCFWPIGSFEPHLCIAIPSYRTEDDPAGWALYRVDGQDFPAINVEGRRKVKRRKIHNLAGTSDAWIHGRGREDLIAADRIWKVEGPSDALALAGILPPGDAVITNTAGANSGLAGMPFDLFRGKTVYCIGDADEAGVAGAKRHAEIIANAERGARVYLLRLPYPVAESHGQDLRDWLLDGNGADSLGDLIETGELVSPAPEGAAPERSKTSDLANAERLVARHRNEIRYCHAWGKWLVWDGRRWRLDDTAEIVRRAKETVRSIYAEAADAEDQRERQQIANWAKQSESKSRIDAMVSLASSEAGIPVLVDQLDRDPWILVVQNGTIDLRTGKLRPSRQDDFATKLCNTSFDPSATCPTWLAYLDRVFAGNASLINFVQRAAGYSLTGDTSERCMFVLHGPGRNGKSTFVETVADVLAIDEYSTKTPTESLMIKHGGGGIPNDIARLKGARFVWASESEEGQRLAESMIKALTGRDTISARFMRGEFFNFKPEFKIWLGTNHRPDIRGTDDAIWDRIKLIPFSVRLSEAEQDKQLPEKLKREYPGILAWLVRGCLAWQADGLGEPEEVKAATHSYREEQDLVSGWTDDCCILDEHAKQGTSELYASYVAWCNDNGMTPLSQKRLTQKLVDRGMSREKPASGPHRNKWVVRGIMLNKLAYGPQSDEGDVYVP